MRTQELIKRFDLASDKRKAGDYSDALAEFDDLAKRSEHSQDIAALRLFQSAWSD
jgi:hypothetical protein